MTASTERADAADSGVQLAAEDVAAFLHQSPDFLLRFPQLVDVLELPHDCGPATSLLQYQGRRLRAARQESEQRISGLIRVARENENVHRRLHVLVLELLGAQALDEAVGRIHAGLREHFQVDASCLLLFSAENTAPDRRQGYRLLAEDAPELAPLDGLRRDRRPLCGRLSSAQRELLFAASGEQLRSAAVMLLPCGSTLGVLAIGSIHQERFLPGMGTVFLEQLAEVAAAALAAYRDGGGQWQVEQAIGASAEGAAQDPA